MAQTKEFDLGASPVKLKTTDGVVYEVRQAEKGGILINTAQGSFAFSPANLDTPKPATAITAAQKALEIGSVAADGWYCIDTKNKIEMSPPVIMTWEQAAYLTWNKKTQDVFLTKVLGDPDFPKAEGKFRLPTINAAAKEFNKLSDGEWEKFAKINNEALDAGKTSLIILPSDATLTQMFKAFSHPNMQAAIAAGKVQDLDRSGSYPAGRVWGAAHYYDHARVQFPYFFEAQRYSGRGYLAEARFTRPAR